LQQSGVQRDMSVRRRPILRVNQLLPRTITSVLMKPQGFANRIRRVRAKGYDPRRVIREKDRAAIPPFSVIRRPLDLGVVSTSPAVPIQPRRLYALLE
jgi:hypothetical protein